MLKIAIIIIFANSVTNGSDCRGGFETTASDDGYTNLQCDTVQDQVFVFPEIAKGRARVEVNGRIFENCTLDQARTAGDEGDEVTLFYRCPQQEK
jgi:hypothetical protein